MKLRLCRSFWRAFASIHPLIFLLFLERLSFLEPAFLHCGVQPFLSMPSLWSPSLAKAQLSPTLRSGALDRRLCFFFLLAKAALTYLPTALCVVSRPLFPFQRAQYARAFLLKPAPCCKLFAGLGSTNKSASSPSI